MSSEIWAVIGVGLALAGLVWRLHTQADRRFDRLETRFDHLDTRFDRMADDLTTVKERLTAVETTVALLIKGLHIEVSGREG